MAKKTWKMQCWRMHSYEPKLTDDISAFRWNFQQRSDEKVLCHDPNSIKVVVRKQCKADAALGISIQGEGACWRGSNQVLQTNWQDLKCHKCWKFFFVKPRSPCRGWQLKSVWIESIILHLVTRFQLIWVQLLIFHTNLWSVSGEKGEQPELLVSGKYEAVCRVCVCIRLCADSFFLLVCR